jgi:hypothetical protein
MAFREYFLVMYKAKMQISVCIDPKNAYIFSGYAALIPLKVPNAEE